MIMTKAFWAGACERFIKTWLQAFLATLGVQIGAVFTLGQAMGLPWLTALITATLAALLSLATSIANADFTAGGPSELRATPVSVRTPAMVEDPEALARATAEAATLTPASASMTGAPSRAEVGK